MTNQTTQALEPELPEPYMHSHLGKPMYCAAQVRAAIEADRNKREANTPTAANAVDREAMELARADQSPIPITNEELAAFHRFCDCCEDSDADGHDVPKAMMSQLVRIGLLRPAGPGRHETTKFGDWMRDSADSPAATAAAAGQPEIDKLERVSNWINEFPVPTKGATAMMILLKQVQDTIRPTACSASDRSAAPVGEELSIEQLADLLPEGVCWGEHLTPDIARALLSQRVPQVQAAPQEVVTWREICERSAGAVLNGKKGLIILEDDLVRIGNLLASQAAPAVPTEWRKFVEDCSKTAGGMVNGNHLSILAGRLLAAAPMPTQEG